MGTAKHSANSVLAARHKAREESQSIAPAMLAPTYGQKVAEQFRRSFVETEQWQSNERAWEWTTKRVDDAISGAKSFASSWAGTATSVALSGVSAVTGFGALAAASSIAGAPYAVALGWISVGTGAAATAIDCLASGSSFSCQLGIASTATGPAIGWAGRTFRASAGSIGLMKDAANAGLLPAGLATTIGGLPALWQ